MKEIHPGIHEHSGKLYTKNLVPGETVYGEKTVDEKGEEFREWEPGRSKLGAAIKNGLPETGIKKDSKVLYLGAASGTTVSHVSDIARKGVVFGIEYSKKVVRDLLRNSKKRENVCPILGDARKPSEYSNIVDKVDIVFQDVAQPDQAKIFRKNCDKFLKDSGIGLLAIKSQSISSSRPAKEIFREQEEKMKKFFEIKWKSGLEPHEEGHMFYLLEKK